MVATRSRPSCSDSAYWLSSQPDTDPDAAYRGRPAPGRSNLCTSVRCGRAWGRAGPRSGPSAVAGHSWAATYRLVAVP